MALVLAGLGIAAYLSWASDRAILREVALRETERYDNVPQRIRALNSWVYRNRGFAKNANYFALARLGPTPVQVLQYGGDCSDKSRLLSALLAEIEIDSTLAMLYPCETCPAGHTVVEARYEDGAIVLDPVYDIDFPDSSGGFLSLDNLSIDHASLVARIHELRSARGPGDKINGYGYEDHSYRYVRTINWSKNWMTRLVGRGLEILGFDPFLVRRPHLLEDPKRFLSIASFLLTSMFLAIGGACVWFASRRTAERGG